MFRSAAFYRTQLRYFEKGKLLPDETDRVGVRGKVRVFRETPLTHNPLSADYHVGPLKKTHDESDGSTASALWGCLQIN